MNNRLRVYLAGQADQYESNWKQAFKALKDFEFHDWEIDSDQTSPDTYFPDDLRGVLKADVMIANPGIAPSEGTWIEIGYFYAQHTQVPGERCEQLIIVWPDSRQPKWSLEFVQKAGIVVPTVEEAMRRLDKLAATRS